ncbi:hypothetical protein ACFLQ0_04720 [Nitrospinota bacterium]
MEWYESAGMTLSLSSLLAKRSRIFFLKEGGKFFPKYFYSHERSGDARQNQLDQNTSGPGVYVGLSRSGSNQNKNPAQQQTLNRHHSSPRLLPAKSL